MNSLYDDLGVAPDADDGTIKRAYRKLSKAHHPDAGGREEDFIRTCRAYEVLSDPERRRRYDETGDASEPKDAVGEKALELLSNAFDLAVTGGTGDRIDVDSLRHLDLPGEMRRYLSNDERTVKDTLAAGAKLRAALVDMYARVEKAPERDVFGEVLAGRIRQVDETAKRVEFQRDALRRAMAMLDGYAYRVDPRKMDWSVTGTVNIDFMDVQELDRMGLFKSQRRKT